MATIFMFDDANVALLPDADAYAAYDDGFYNNLAQIRAAHPNADILSIAVNANDVADALDIEKGAATDAQLVAWYKKSLSAGVTKPTVYAAVSNMDGALRTLANAGIPRTAVRVWTAHFTNESHLCGPTTCKECETSADATQFTQTADGRSLDESVCEANFFTRNTPPSPNPYPTLTKGDTGTNVEALQTRLNDWHANPKLVVDGSFGTSTFAAVTAFQADHKLTVDGVVGPATWGLLVKAPTVQPFGAPTGLRVAADISIAWDEVAAVDGAKPASYKVEITDAGAVFKTLTVSGTATTVSGLTRNKVYEISVTAEGGQGVAASARMSVTA